MPENKILLFSKCVERRFAEKLFYEGVLHFGYPSEWIKKAEEGNVGQGEQTEPVGREGDYVVYDMSDAYAQDFSGEETWENRFDTAFEDRKAMVVIHRPQVFLDKVKRRFADFRLEEGRDYYMGCVQYRKEGETEGVKED